MAILRAYGAEVDIVTDPHPETGEFLDARLARISQIISENPDAFWPNQYQNPANPEAHYLQTAVEILRDLGRPPDGLIAATSTCGTIAGLQRYFHEIGAHTKIIAVDAVGSAIFGQAPQKRHIPGLGSSRRPDLIDPEGVRVVHVSSRDCVAGCRLLARQEAILAGGSSGGVVLAAGRIAPELPKRSNIVVILPDRGDRYIDTVYSDAWVLEHLEDPGTILEERDV